MPKTPVAFQGSYSDLRFVKSRSVAVISIEMPIEQASAFVAAFGVPSPGAEIPVALARLHPEKPPDPDPDVAEPPDPDPDVAEPPDPDPGVEIDLRVEEPDAPPKRRFKDMPLPQQAGICCGEEAFARFLAEKYPGQGKTPSEVVRALCGVTSRAQLATNDVAATKWRSLYLAYGLWLRYPGHARGSGA